MRSRDDISDEDDFFKDTRMSFGDHIEVLRRHLWRAIAGLILCMCIGFVLDAIGDMLDMPFIGIGRPLVEIIKRPVSKALAEFYDNRVKEFQKKEAKGGAEQMEANRPRKIPVHFDHDDLAKLAAALGTTPEKIPAGGVDVVPEFDPLATWEVIRPIESIIRPRELSAMSAQESFLIYIKVSLIAGLVIASPWVFWQIWSFIAAGLYPSEKRFVHVYLPVSVTLFIVGVVLCQFVVMPRTVAALLYFNDFIGITPDLRLSEWLTVAILMPAVFGVSFQTPLVMLFLERIGLLTVDSFKRKRKIAVFVLAVFAMIVTPTPDALTMSFLWIPMCLLYELGIWLCYFSPSRRNRNLEDLEVPESEELIEV
jgi:sec-independent protein translocase protein TatC